MMMMMILGHFGDGGVTAASARIVAEIQSEYKRIVMVWEQVLVLFRARTTSLQSGLGTFFVPESDHGMHFCEIYSV